MGRMIGNPPVLEVKDLKKNYKSNAGILSQMLGNQSIVQALDGISFKINPSQTLGIVGESGSGKSTLAETILRLEEPSAGEIYINDEDICNKSGKNLRKFRKHMQIIFQDPYESINPKKRIYQIIAEPLKNLFDLDHTEREERIEEILHEIGLRPAKEYMHKYPEQLSGGQLQRVNIAKAVVVQPTLLIADEPLSMLDVSTQANILQLLDDLQKRQDFAMMYITHDIAVARIVSDRMGVMYHGRILEIGETEKIVNTPKHPYTQALISAIPQVGGERERTLLPRNSSDETDLPLGCNFAPRCSECMEEICLDQSPALVRGDTDRKVACFLYHEQSDQVESSNSNE